MSKLIGKAVQGLSTGIGLAAEKYYDRKERKAALEEQGRSTSSLGSAEQQRVSETNEISTTGDEITNDERIWALDEAAGLPPAYKTLEVEPNSNSDEIVAEIAHDVAIAKDHQSEIYEGESARLPYPVIIPQRRPGSKARGWTRAYAPALEPMGIDQETFLKFIAGWDKAAEGSPWFKAVQLTSGIIGMAFPGPMMMGITTAVSIIAGAGHELQGRYKANSFLDKMNQEVFMPAGLYAMVIICKQDASTNTDIEFSVQTANLENAKNVSKWGLPGNNEEQPLSTSSKLMRPIRIASGKANVDEMPLEIAPLIYPGLDDMVNRPELNRDESFKERIMRNKVFVADYFDRRARADFAGNNPDAALVKASGNTPEFKSRFADPNHPCNNGHLVSLVTGGKYVAQDRGLHGARGVGDLGGGRRRGGLLGNALASRQESGLVGRGGLLAARQYGGYRGDGCEDDGQLGNDRAHGRGHGSRLQDRIDRRQVRRGPPLREVGEDGKLKPREKQPATKPRGPIGYVMKGVKKVLKPDVMYLTIVNLPTEEEMEMAREILGMDKKGWQEVIKGIRLR